jgi:hypothetical protein
MWDQGGECWIDLSTEWPNGHLGLWFAPWSGASNPTWLVGPVTMHNIKRWGCRRLMSRGSPLSLFPTNNPNSDLQRVRSQWWKATTVFTATVAIPPRRSCCRDTLRFTDHHCTCSDCITEPSMAGTSSNSATPAIPSDGLCLLPHSLLLSLCV